jgi:hypothetical protein
MTVLARLPVICQVLCLLSAEPFFILEQHMDAFIRVLSPDAK